MNKESKKVLRRKLIVLGIMLAVLFGSIAVAGIAKRGDYLAVAHAEEVNPSEWEVVKTEYSFKGTAQDDEIMQSIYEIGYFSAKVENGNIVVSFTFSIDYDYTKFNNTTYFHKLNFIFDTADGDSITVEKNLDYYFFYDPKDYTGIDYPKANDTFDFPFSVTAFTSLSGVTSKNGVSVSSITDFNINAIAVAGDSENLPFSEIKSPDNVLISEKKYYKLPTAPEKEGYVFTGWYTDEACTNKYTGTTVTADTALYAGYEKQILTVTLDNDGATETMAVEYGNTVTLPDKTKDGYDFLGWYFSDDTKYFDQAITSNVTLIAKYRKKPVINLDNNGITETLTVEYNEAASLPTKTKTGYNFLGWYLPDGTKYDGQAVTSDLTLTAKFEVIMLKVRFFVDGVEYKTVDVPYGSSFSEAVEKASLKQSSVKSVVLLTSVAGEGEETPAVDQSLPEELTSDIKAKVDVSALDAAKEQTTSWFKTTWEKIADFFVNLWAKISGFFVTAWEAVCNHFRNNWKWYAIGGGSAAGLAIIIAVICKVRR